ncbi:response regulator transcription factor [Paraclostridium sordellii]|uniref:Stage 0 sporulation protein A homolog n=1 Tax=Paraclostridium sordellii TaxID=1505 RepID=A0A0C7R6L8_PARSO|nr:response regulator transcription factor [Paeniclostridium sordellii]CEN80115.1 regulatory protein VanR [[Clostridium] sordellii] [Paeniclostridium sordellii]CEO13421.1 regulatory protein VanR [[Clostridium] sordellii] [Paeniclostridium sordellii]CEP89021.1 regulatory protein VanR [[Clostridium] sordellii] [Paeniclostridium sordellii]CEP97902.1 regulatory protein VanR [[Clostridium] sordellii] [Paeniclostridium sordellii]CEQ01290.1 regulatory protein VanR [[Clostridium] sordellii] [Paeniclos
MDTILIIEDDKDLNRGVSFALKKDGYNVISNYNISEGYISLKQNDIDFLLLDINLPDGSGLDFCKKINDKINFPIVFFTANGSQEDMIKGFERGCDDYIVKPFSIDILKLKINAILKRNIDIFTYKDLKIDFNSRNIFINDEKINLTVTEYNLLKLLSKNKGRIITKEVILKKLWDNRGNYVDENAISTNIRRLRQKLGDDSKNSKYISTAFGIGYVMGE